MESGDIGVFVVFRVSVSTAAKGAKVTRLNVPTQGGWAPCSAPAQLLVPISEQMQELGATGESHSWKPQLHSNISS